ncbi:hypothetical protein GCM10010198_03160 [Nocardia seriolae]|nr:hypothetical protein NS2_58630 [Nocardia seriolae NBRC 15557]
MVEGGEGPSAEECDMDSQQGQRTAVLDIRGLHWASQQNVVKSVLGRRPGVLEVDPNPVSQTATVTFDPARTSVADLRTWVHECGLHCAGQSVPSHLCDPLAEPADTDHRGHAPADADHAAHAGMDHDQHAEMDHAEHAGVDHGAHAEMDHAGMGHGHAGHGGMSMEDMARDMRNRFVVAAVFSVLVMLWSPMATDMFGWHLPVPFGMRADIWELALSLPVIFYSSTIFFTGAWAALKARTLDMMVLVAVGIGAGWLYSLAITLTGGGEVFYEASTMLATFVLLGHWFEMRARGGANDAIRTLLDLAPPRAVVIRDGQEVEIPTAEVQVGDLLLVRPGSKIAVDGTVEEGTGEVDESMVTGESLPVHKEPGATVIGATLNKNGTLRVRATKVGSDTALAQIVNLVQQAQNSKAPGQRLADRAAFWLVLVALLGGALTLVVWLLAGATFAKAMLFAITVVVVTCPDALGLATPTAIMVGTGLGAKRGVLFKNAMALESSARIETVVVDKTGTLTKGEPEVTEIVTGTGFSEAELLPLLAAVERESEHPLADAVVRYAKEHGSNDARAVDFQNVPGHGAIATVDGRRVVIGNRRLLDRENIDLGELAAARDRVAGAWQPSTAGPPRSSALPTRPARPPRKPLRTCTIWASRW